MRTREHLKALLSWSSGKDSAYALSMLRKRADLEVVGLFTTIDECTRRVPIHSVSEQLLDLQSEALGLQLWKIEIPWPCSNTVYQDAMSTVAQRAAREGISQVAYGDLFLADIRTYREETLKGTGLEPIFPLWGLQTADLAAQMLAAGVKATMTCVDRMRLDPSFVGVAFDGEFIKDLPPDVDPCGENGEFHTFVWDGPEFSTPVPVRVGNIVEEDRFVFADMLPTHFE
ncbi:MAG: ATPase [Chloroflexota bacterium]